MHIERHDGFDRIVYDFGGTYATPWRAEYVAEATQRGKETATRINGRSILQIYFFDTDSSAESGIAAYNEANPLSEPAAHSVVEVHLTPNYERHPVVRRRPYRLPALPSHDSRRTDENRRRYPRLVPHPGTSRPDRDCIPGATRADFRDRSSNSLTYLK